jgi:hypothetical protein
MAMNPVRESHLPLQQPTGSPTGLPTATGQQYRRGPRRSGPRFGDFQITHGSIIVWPLGIAPHPVMQRLGDATHERVRGVDTSRRIGAHAYSCGPPARDDTTRAWRALSRRDRS